MSQGTHLAKDHPIVIGFAGKAGTGKTSTVEMLMHGIEKEAFLMGKEYRIMWDHITHATPLYEFVTIRTKVTGANAEERQKAQIKNNLEELLGGSIKRFKNYRLNKLTKKIYNLPIPEDEKPRTFLQTVGTLCRKVDKDCFAKWATNKVDQRFALVNGFYDPDEDEEYADTIARLYVYILSDVRLINEASNIKSRPNSCMIQFVCDEDVVLDRLLERDGHVMDSTQKKHESEIEQETPEFLQYVDWTVDTSELTLEEQALQVKKIALALAKEIVSA